MNDRLAALCCWEDLLRWVISRRNPSAQELTVEETEANASFGYALATYALIAPLNQEDRRLVFSVGTRIFDVSISAPWASMFIKLLDHAQVADDPSLQWFLAIPLVDHPATAESSLRLAVSLELPAIERKKRDEMLVGLFQGRIEFPVGGRVLVEIATQILDISNPQLSHEVKSAAEHYLNR